MRQECKFIDFATESETAARGRHCSIRRVSAWNTVGELARNRLRIAEGGIATRRCSPMARRAGGPSENVTQISSLSRGDDRHGTLGTFTIAPGSLTRDRSDTAREHAFP